MDRGRGKEGGGEREEGREGEGEEGREGEREEGREGELHTLRREKIGGGED